MLVGKPYLESAQKRRFDLALVTMVSPARDLARGAAMATFLSNEEVCDVFDERIGKNRNPFILRKLATRATGECFSPLAQFYERTGIDELEQIENVRRGEMSFFGARPLPAHEHEQMHHILSRTNHGRELLAEHDDIVMPHPPGILSTFGVQIHFLANASPEVRLRMNIEDCRNASMRHDLSLLAACTKGLVAKVTHATAKKG